MANKKKVSRGIVRRRGKVKPRNQKQPQSFSVLKTVSVPTAVGTLGGSRAALSMRVVNDPGLGQGVEFSGSQLFCYLVCSGSAGYVLSTTTGPSSSSVLAVSPYDIAVQGVASAGTDYITQCAPYLYYRNVFLRFRTVPNVGTATASSIALAYYPGCYSPGDTGVATPSYSRVATFQYSIESPVWKPSALVVSQVPRDKFGYYVDYDPLSSSLYMSLSDVRQGNLYGMTDCLTSGVSFGRVIMDYKVQCYCKGALASAGIAASFGIPSSLQDEKDRAAIAHIRARNRELSQIRNPLFADPSDPRILPVNLKVCADEWVPHHQTTYGAGCVPISLDTIRGNVVANVNDTQRGAALAVDLTHVGDGNVVDGYIAAAGRVPVATSALTITDEPDERYVDCKSSSSSSAASSASLARGDVSGGQRSARKF